MTLPCGRVICVEVRRLLELLRLGELNMDLEGTIAVTAFAIFAAIIAIAIQAYDIDLGLFWTAIVS